MGAIGVSGRLDAPSGTADIGELYGELSARLQRIVRHGVRAPEPVIEDACQVAWARLVDRHDRVSGATTLPWLVETARHEALKLVRREGRDHSLEGTLESVGDGPLRALAPALGAVVAAPDELAIAHERLAQLERLPTRQQRLMWLHGLGFSYAEMARQTGDTTRTVERQLLRAKRAARGFELE